MFMMSPSGNQALNLRNLEFYDGANLYFLFFSQWTEEDEITDYKKNQEWMDECMDGMFEKWYDKIDEMDSMEDRRKVRQL